MVAMQHKNILVRLYLVYLNQRYKKGDCGYIRLDPIIHLLGAKGASGKFSSRHKPLLQNNII